MDYYYKRPPREKMVIIIISLIFLCFSLFLSLMLPAATIGYDLKVSLFMWGISFLGVELIVLGSFFFVMRTNDPVREFWMNETSVTGKSKKKTIVLDFNDITNVTIYTKNNKTIYCLHIFSESSIISLTGFPGYDRIIDYLKTKLPDSVFEYNNYQTMPLKKKITIGILILAGTALFLGFSFKFLNIPQIKSLSSLLIGITSIYEGVVSKKIVSKIFYILAGIVLLALFGFIFFNSFS